MPGKRKRSQQSQTGVERRRGRERRLSAIERLASRGASLESTDTTENPESPIPWRELERLEWLHGFTPRWAILAARYSIAEFQRIYSDGIRGWTLDSESAGALAIATGGRGMTEALLLSNKKIRLEAASVLIDVMKTYWKDTRAQAGRTWWFITFVGDCGNALEYDPVIGVDLFRRKIDKLLRKANLEAVFAIEVQALTNFPQRGAGRTFMFHAHAIAWTDDPNFDPTKVERALRASRSLRHWLGAKTVHIEEIPNAEQHIKWRCYYLLKAPFLGKYLRRSSNTPSGFELADTPVRSDLAVRLMECLTQLEFTQMVWGVGSGKLVRGEWRRRLKHWHQRQLRRPGRTLAKDFDMAGLWKDLRRRRPNNKHKPFRFIAKRSGRGPTEWEVAAKASMEAKAARASKGGRDSWAPL